MRSKSKKESTQEMANYPHLFAEIRHKEASSIIIPCHTTENRTYIPFGYLDSRAVITNSSQAIYNAEPWIFGVISCKMHMVWVRATCGRIKTDYRYSSAICYNNFPIPDLTEAQKKEITQHAFEVLSEREQDSEKPLADLYDPDKMPDSLLVAHECLDEAVEKCYRAKPFTSDEERLEHLFKLYQEMTESEPCLI